MTDTIQAPVARAQSTVRAGRDLLGDIGTSWAVVGTAKSAAADDSSRRVPMAGRLCR